MPIAKRKITPCLWFDTQAEAAANFYVSIFKNSKIKDVSYYPNEGKETHGKDAGTVMMVDFELDGQPFVGLNGGPRFTFDEAISFQVFCDSQEEVDYYWEKLTAGGAESNCGWLKDKYGLSWQVVPTVLIDMIKDKNAVKAQRVMKAFMQMRKYDIATLQRAYEGTA